MIANHYRKLQPNYRWSEFNNRQSVKFWKILSEITWLLCLINPFQFVMKSIINKYIDVVAMGFQLLPTFAIFFFAYLILYNIFWCLYQKWYPSNFPAIFRIDVYERCLDDIFVTSPPYTIMFTFELEQNKSFHFWI